jgi:hypothetical protein
MHQVQQSYQAYIDAKQFVLNFLKEKSLLPGTVDSTAASEANQLSAVQAAIQTAALDQISKTDDFFRKLAEDWDSRRKQLDEQYSQKQFELEERVRVQQEQVRSEQEAIDKLQKELDDRSNTHARRAIRGDLLKTVQGRQLDFTISSGTKRLRIPIHAIFIIILAATLGGAVWSLYAWGTTELQNWDYKAVSSAIKTVVFTFGFLTTAGLYISWMNRWFDRHAEAQFHTKQFEIDINRASWAVEAALEWKGSQNEQMPEALMTGITKHLFENHVGESPDYSPMDALATSILGAASNLSMKMGGAELSLDRKGIKQIAKASDHSKA